jgi:hypothetical protein
MNARFCIIAVILELIIVVAIAFMVGVHNEKIAWLEDCVLKKGGCEYVV